MADYLGYERAFKNFGISYTVEPGAYERGHGDLNGVKFIVLHHTAGGGDAGDIRIVRDGRSDLPGPLSQLVLKRNGQPHLIAVGVCWHAYGTIAYRGVPARSGNYWSIGIEGVSNGYNDWTPEQRREYPRVVAALLKDIGLPSDAFIFHRDYQPGEKIDPAGFTRDWFQAEVNRHYNSGGTPTAPVKGDIEKKRDVSPWLGNKLFTEPERVCPDGKGRYAHYENGSVYWTPETGACAMSKEMFDKYATVGYETGFLKYPVKDVSEVTSGIRVQPFQGGSIYWTEKNGARIVCGAIGDRYGQAGWEKGELGTPVTDEIKLPDEVGVLQVFNGGHIYYSPITGAHVIKGLVWDEFSKQNYEKGAGYPLTSEVATPNAEGVFQKFEYSHIYYKQGSARAFTIFADILDIYARFGYEAGRLGWPISNRELVDSSWVQHFEGGTITYNPTTKAIILIVNGRAATLVG